MSTSNSNNLDLYKELYLFDQLQEDIENSIAEIQGIYLKEDSLLTIETLLQNEEYNKSITKIKNIYSQDLKDTIKSITEDEFDFYMEYISKENNVNYFKYLVENGFDVNRKFCGETLLSYMINRYQDFEPVEIVYYLLSSGGDFRIKVEDIDEMGDITGKTSLLESAILHKYVNIVKLLIKNKAHLLVPDSSLFYAVNGKHYNIVKLLLNDIDLDKVHNNGFSELISSIKNSDIQMVKILLDANININSKYVKYGFTPLMIAVANNVNILIDKIKNDDTLKVATKEASISNLKKQVFDNHNKIATLLIEKGAYLDTKDNYGATAFDIARESKNYEILKVLLEMSKKDKFSTKLKTQIHLEYSNYSKSDGKRYHQQRYFDNFIPTENSKNITELKECVKEGGDAKRINIIDKIINNFDSEYIQFAIENGAKIDILDSDKGSALHHAVKANNLDIVKVLLEHDIDILQQNKYTETAFDIVNTKDIFLLILNYEEKLQKHNPKELIKLLTFFREADALRDTTHEWDKEFTYNFKKNYGDFKGFLAEVKKQWDEKELELKKLSPLLHKKMYNFLLNDKSDSLGWCSREGDDINIGWSSLNGLERWVNDGNDPFNFETKNYKIDGKTINTFGDIIKIFKREVQVKTGKLECIREKNMLKNIFKSINKNYNFELDFTDLTESQFYTDVATLKNVLNILFEQFSESSEYFDIKIESCEDCEDKYYIFKVIQIGSFRNETIKQMKDKVKGGHFSKIKDNLSNLCDWSVESRNEKEKYRINYLNSDNRVYIETDVSPVGYTHIFRFYK